MKELRSIRQLDNRQLSQKIKYALFENIKESIHGNELLKLPKEEVLAQQLGVSRNGLRDVLTVLEEEGYISRRRSKGTIVNPKNSKQHMQVGPGDGADPDDSRGRL